ncbi:MAG: cysteine hydrolase family protein [Thalassobaculum sp.]
MPETVIVANHYQNENCHPDGKVKVGIAADADWRWQRLDNAKRLFAGARAAGVPIVHVRLAVDPAYRDVIVNTPLIREWLELGAWKEGSWGTEFVEGLGPVGVEHVVTHTRNSGFQDFNARPGVVQARGPASDLLRRVDGLHRGGHGAPRDRYRL